jgi:hypothetical protein
MSWMALLTDNWSEMANDGMVLVSIVIVFDPYPKIAQQLIRISDKYIKGFKLIH